ncbi:MAG: biosynthetic arginine decarboxylase [Myxococcota bacterium]
MPDGDRPTWSVGESAQLYQTNAWGNPYFKVNDQGHVEVRPTPGDERAIDLYELTRDLKERGLTLPYLLRFSDILQDRIRMVNHAFSAAIQEYDYGGEYRGVFPVKVNQQRHVVEEVVRYGDEWAFGLEAGSKPELMIALALLDKSDGLLICNGYKDLLYIETALIAQRLSRTVILVLERVEELDLVFRAADKLGIAPILGVRAKLGSKGMGRWAESAGDGAKFGLSAAEVVEVVDRLEARGMLDSLQLLHFHIGSQVSSIIPIKNALREASRFYVELAQMGAKMGYLDVGGGLAIDYDGSKTDFHASKNYTTQEYAYDVVAAIQEACEKSDVAAPTIISESGRAISAHQSVLVFDVVGTNHVAYPEPNPPGEDAHSVIRELFETYRAIVPKNVQESWHDATQAKEEANSLYKFGYLTLRERAQAERLFWHCATRIMEQLSRLKFVPEEIQEIQNVLSTIYYCNFSIFQSAPDTWAIDQLFPVMPIHRLDERPTVHARLADLTCDSDGIIDNFIDQEEERRVLDVHPFRPGQPYYMAMFLIGAYQEILGDLHNLFGDTHAVHVSLSDHGYHVSHLVKGDSMHDVLRYVSYDPETMTERVRQQAEEALQRGAIELPQMRLLMEHYEESLRSYTYLSSD